MNAWRIFRYEIRRGLTRPSYWLLFALFACLGFAAVQAFAGTFDRFRLVISLGGETLWVNSAYFIALATRMLTALGLPLTAAFFISALHRETGDGSGPLLWTTPLGTWSYWCGRSASALGLNLLLLTGVCVGVWIGTQMPWIDPSLIGEARFSFYAQPFGLTAVRRTLLAGALVGLAVVLTRSAVAGYLAVVALIGAHQATRQLTADLDNRALAAMIDPSGSVAAGLITRTWSTAEKNAQLVPIEGLVATNLAIWLGVSLAVWIVAGLCFRPERQALAPEPGWIRRLSGSLDQLVRHVAIRPVGALVSRLPLWLKATLEGYRSVVTHPMFVLTVLFGLASLAVAAPSVTMLFGTPTWPVTYAVLEVMATVFEPFAVGVTIFFAGHLLWRSRELGLKPLLDATPHGPVLPVLTTVLAMFGVLVTLQATLGATGVLYQRFQDHTRHEWTTYALDLFVLRLADLALWLMLTVFLQLLIQRKAAAYFASATAYLAVRFSPAIGIDHVLLRFGADPGYTFSEVNGIGDFLGGWFLVKGYWFGVAGLLLVLCVLLWPRGTSTDLASTRQRAARRWSTPLRYASTLAGAAVLTFGGLTVYNVHALNDYRSATGAEKDHVHVERTVRPWLERAQPRIASARYTVDLFPRENRAEVRGSLKLTNPHGEPIESLLLRVPQGLELLDVVVGDAAVSEARIAAEPTPIAGPYYRLDLETPIAADATVGFTYRGRWHRRGFANSQPGGGVIDNGSFLFSTSMAVGFGYDPGGELSDPRRRRRFGLPERPPLPSLDAPGVRRNSLTVDADPIPFEVLVTTDADQIALAPGDRIHTSESDGRKTFTYRSAVPMHHLWAVVSGRYAVASEHWRGIDLEIYHQPEHDENIDSMVRGMKRSLEYLTATFGDYPHKALRIVEFPRYSRFAMSLPGLIPYSESIGFIARKRSAEDIDYPFYVTAHEVAHQWFPHEVGPAHAEGMAFLSETFAQYIALRVMEEQFGTNLIGTYLRYELDRYLLGRSVARVEERPLATVHRQQHVYYNKGSLAIYAAAELIGRDAMDAALAAYLERFGGGEPPYPTSDDFLEILRSRAAPEHHRALEDLFERITFFDLAVEDASCEALGSDRYRVTLDLTASKSYADGGGELTPAVLDDVFDIGVFAERRVLRKMKPVTLELERRRLTGATRVMFEVDQLPLRAGIDPFFRMVDRRPEDNVVDLSCEGEADSSVGGMGSGT
ncbi:MAG: M1 family aminopeptidase [Acidobacteriota bacterium]